MAAIKSATALTWASGSATASGTTNTVDTSTSYAAEVYVQIVQVGTASVPASFFLDFEPDGSTDFAGTVFTAGTAAGTYTWVIIVPVTAEKVKLVYTAQSGGTSSTLTGQVGQVTGI